MKTYSFTVILDDEEMTEELANRIYEAGCDDASCGSTAGTVYVDIDREADSLEDAFRSATSQLEKIGCTIKRSKSTTPPCGEMLLKESLIDCHRSAAI